MPLHSLLPSETGLNVCHCLPPPPVPSGRYIEELDLLALALGGHFRHQPQPLLCQLHPGASTA